MNWAGRTDRMLVQAGIARNNPASATRPCDIGTPSRQDGDANIAAPGGSVSRSLQGFLEETVPANPERIGGNAHVDEQRASHDVRPRQEPPVAAVVGLVPVVAHDEEAGGGARAVPGRAEQGQAAEPRSANARAAKKRRRGGGDLARPAVGPVVNKKEATEKANLPQAPRREGERQDPWQRPDGPVDRRGR